MVRSLADTAPAEPEAASKRRIAAAVDAAREEIIDLSHRIHAHPEVACLMLTSYGGLLVMSSRSSFRHRCGG